MTRPAVLLGLATVAFLNGCSSPSAATTNASPTNVPPTNATPSNTTPSNATPDATVGRSSDDSRVYPRAELAVLPVKIKGQAYDLWSMDTGGKRQEGMMFLRDEDVKANQGMLFSFPEEQKGTEANGFWMRNTYLPLDIIYVSKSGRVVSVGKGVPFSEETVKPGGDYRSVIELKGGTAAKIGLKPGDAITLPSGIKATD